MGGTKWRVASILALTALLSVMALAAAPAAPGAAGGTGQWRVEQESRADDIKIAAWLGREALWLRNNTHAVRVGAPFEDGTIEFDLAPMERGDFAALTFRRASLTNHENVYLRLSRSGEF